MSSFRAATNAQRTKDQGTNGPQSAQAIFGRGFQTPCAGRRDERFQEWFAFRWSCEARRTCNRSWRPCAGCEPRWAACTPIARRYQSARTACSYATRIRSAGIGLMDRSRREVWFHSRRSARRSGCPSGAESSARNAPAWDLVVGLMAAPAVPCQNPDIRVADTFCRSLEFRNWDLGIRAERMP